VLAFMLMDYAFKLADPRGITGGLGGIITGRFAGITGRLPIHDRSQTLA